MRNARVWAAFGVCLAVVLLAMAWSSATVLRLERAESGARAQAALEENARLALWRMDSALTSALAEESARPYREYGAPGTGDAPYALLHFQVAPDGHVTSPPVPGEAGDERRARLADLRGRISRAGLLAQLPREGSPAMAPAAPANDKRNVTASVVPESLQQMKNAKEFEARQQNVIQLQSKKLAPPPPGPSPARARLPQVEEGAMAALWAGDALLLARRVRVDGAVHLQGSWLDWPRLQADLLASVRDLLPAARLEPAGGSVSSDERRLAALPLRLVPGAAPALDPPGLSPARLSLAGAWAGVLMAALAVAALLRGVLDLSERRRVFVSAVTHELRTPLTTFRLYADMLADGMVPDGEKRGQYLERLRGEAERLSHLVENVLFYSRIESGRAGATRETVEVAGFLRETSRLTELARAGGLELRLHAGDEPLRARLDRSALEQVLVNLVDNACKYAAPSEPAVIELSVERRDGHALIRVRDHGPGLSRADRRRLFRAFSKSDREAAASRPGVGLGLALSRRLMRAQGGDLTVDDAVKDGAAFVLTLPLG